MTFFPLEEKKFIALEKTKLAWKMKERMELGSRGRKLYHIQN